MYCSEIRIVVDVAAKSKKYSNLIEGEKIGLKRLQERIEIGEIVCTVTD